MADEPVDRILAEMRREHDECARRVTREHDELLARIRSEREEFAERIDGRLDRSDDLTRFIGELNRRGEIVLRDVLRGNARMRAEIDESIREIRASTRQIEANTRQTEANTRQTNLNAEASKAHTRAIFALIDRLEGGGLAPAG